MKRTLIRFALVSVLVVGIVGAVSAHPGDGNRGPGRGGDIAEIITEQTGLTAEEIREQLQAGSTLAEVIEANGGDVQAVIDAMVAEATERINSSVEEGRLTQEQADERLAELEQHVTDRLNGEFEPRDGARRGRRGGAGGFGEPETDGSVEGAPEDATEL